MVSGLSEILDYVRRLKGRDIVSPRPEEESEDIEIAGEETRDVDEERICARKVSRSSIKLEDQRTFRYFIDGSVSSLPIKAVSVGNVEVPIHLICIAAGAFERGVFGGPLRPTEHIVSRCLLALPYAAIKDGLGQFERPPGRELTSGSGVYEDLKGYRGPLWIDTSRRLNGSRALNYEDLQMVGRVRSRAANLAKVLMRVAELGVLYSLKEALGMRDDNLILMDGPVAPILIYANLVSDRFGGVREISDPHLAYFYLRNVISAVKRVLKIPRGGFQEVFMSREDELVYVIYRMRSFIRRGWGEEDEEASDKHTSIMISAFTWLRPSLLTTAGDIWSYSSGVARFDIPIPSLANEDEDWYMPDYKVDVNRRDVDEKLDEILKAIYRERYPIPSAPRGSIRRYTELYAIYEAELRLKALIARARSSIGAGIHV